MILNIIDSIITVLEKDRVYKNLATLRTFSNVFYEIVRLIDNPVYSTDFEAIAETLRDERIRDRCMQETLRVWPFHRLYNLNPYNYVKNHKLFREVLKEKQLEALSRARAKATGDFRDLVELIEREAIERSQRDASCQNERSDDQRIREQGQDAERN